MLSEQEAIEIVIDLVPNWYLAECGPVELQIKLGKTSAMFYTHRSPTPELKALLDQINASLPDLFEKTKALPKTTAIEIIHGYFAVLWLRGKNSKIKWKELLEYASEVSLRTYENQNVTFNFVVSEGEGSVKITSPEIQKILDPLSSSIFTFIRINPEMNFINFEEVRWSDIKDTGEYKFNPEFLQPIRSILKASEYSIHLNSRGDIIIMDSSGMLAAKRKSRWKLYDVFTLKNFFVDNLAQGTYRIGANLFEIFWDLSFKRHGALLVYDPNKAVLNHIVNKGSIMDDSFSENQDTARSMLSVALKQIPMASPIYSLRKKRLLLEIASMDGAVIFSNDSVLAFGAMITTHERASQESGARSTAARSAFLWGGYPIKVSSDGEITLFFKSRSRLRECLATTEFL